MHKRTPYCGYDNIPVWTDVDRSTLPSGTRARSHAHTPGGSQHLCSWKTNTDGNACQHTQNQSARLCTYTHKQHRTCDEKLQ